jgi:hypothetical protein
MDGKVAWKTADLHPTAILTELQPQSLKQRKKHSLNFTSFTNLEKAMEESIAFFIFFFS